MNWLSTSKKTKLEIAHFRKIPYYQLIDYFNGGFSLELVNVFDLQARPELVMTNSFDSPLKDETIDQEVL